MKELNKLSKILQNRPRVDEVKELGGDAMSVYTSFDNWIYNIAEQLGRCKMVHQILLDNIEEYHKEIQSLKDEIIEINNRRD